MRKALELKVFPPPAEPSRARSDGILQLPSGLWKNPEKHASLPVGSFKRLRCIINPTQQEQWRPSRSLPLPCGDRARGRPISRGLTSGGRAAPRAGGARAVAMAGVGTTPGTGNKPGKGAGTGTGEREQPRSCSSASRPLPGRARHAGRCGGLTKGGSRKAGRELHRLLREQRAEHAGRCGGASGAREARREMQCSLRGGARREMQCSLRGGTRGARWEM